MTIITKYNIGDTLFFLDSARVKKMQVVEITTIFNPKYHQANEALPIISYRFGEVIQGLNHFYSKLEGDVAFSVEELIRTVTPK